MSPTRVRAGFFQCALCKEIFDEPEHDRVFVGEFWGMNAYESVDCCPYCKADSVVEYREEDDDDDEEWWEDEDEH